ncbi:virion structural protein [Synechococcus phage ACG-2014h]|uniref:Virion structural protein n=1 Tax=Synechococcus phage ACG-2014h TaxID=1340810 RepID=V5UR97_9CAUD|nr:virion structural protein [Synechococcus phage ACG-2014h]AHB80496.1 virion structural protein [Synechococcus phage ACG-2014h]
MATTKEKFDSTGGFSIDKTVIVDELRNAKDLNTLEIKNSEYTDSARRTFILRGLNTAVLQLDVNGTQVTIENDTINFVTGHIMGVNASGTVYSAKLESVVFCDSVGATTVLSSMRTVIKDDVPSGQTWNIDPLGSSNRFSYNTTRAGTTNNIKWVAVTEVVSIEWQ